MGEGEALQTLNTFKFLLMVATVVWTVMLALYGPRLVRTLRPLHRAGRDITARLIIGLLILGVTIAFDVAVLFLRLQFRNDAPAWLDRQLLYSIAWVPIVTGLSFGFIASAIFTPNRDLPVQ